MLYHFKQSFHIAGKDYKNGNHHLTSKEESDPNFLRLVGLGLITEADAPAVVVSQETIHERSKRLLSKLMGQKNLDPKLLAKQEADEAKARAEAETREMEKWEQEEKAKETLEKMGTKKRR
jgi:hypothetical protein